MTIYKRCDRCNTIYALAACPTCHQRAVTIFLPIEVIEYIEKQGTLQEYIDREIVAKIVK